MLYSFEKTISLLNENVKLSTSKDEHSIVNKFTTKPQGILIQDSYNNPFFPIQPKPRLDTSKFDLLEIHTRFREKYSKFQSLLLPWHFCVEMVDNKYFVMNTRPIDFKFPLTNLEVKSMDIKNSWDLNTKKFIDSNIFDISESIHVMIIGDSSLDIYTKKIYQIIGRICISPFIRYFKLPEGLLQRTFILNIGSKFNVDYLSKYIRK